jgi:hypothetical protein
LGYFFPTVTVFGQKNGLGYILGNIVSQTHLVTLASSAAAAGREDIFVCSVAAGSELGCQMVCFQTKNTNLGTFWRVLRWKMLVYIMAIWSIS